MCEKEADKGSQRVRGNQKATMSREEKEGC
jgi:hypothetical protein